jgi:hypothetical protein
VLNYSQDCNDLLIDDIQVIIGHFP